MVCQQSLERRRLYKAATRQGFTLELDDMMLNHVIMR